MTLQIPQDLYPNSDFLEKSKIIGEYYNHLLTTFGRFFSNEQEIITYLQNFNEHADAEYFLETGNILFISRQISEPSLQLVMIISAIEKNTQRNFMDFNSWVNSDQSTFDTVFTEIHKSEVDPKDNLKEILKKLSADYHQQFGARNNFANFIETFASSEDQNRLIMSFRFVVDQAAINYSKRLPKMPDVAEIAELEQTSIQVRRACLPRCYNWERCFVSQTNCDPDIGCLLEEDSTFKQTTIRSMAKTIYDMRSYIVHQAGDVPFVKDLGPGISSFNFVMLGNRPIYIDLRINEFERIMVDALKRYFDTLQ